jgi:hypothetical protein
VACCFFVSWEIAISYEIKTHRQTKGLLDAALARKETFLHRKQERFISGGRNDRK